MKFNPRIFTFKPSSLNPFPQTFILLSEKILGSNYKDRDDKLL